MAKTLRPTRVELVTLEGPPILTYKLKALTDCATIANISTGKESLSFGKRGKDAESTNFPERKYGIGARKALKREWIIRDFTEIKCEYIRFEIV